MAKLALYVVLFFIYSFLGWVMEVGFAFYKKHKFVNRGFLIGPYCPIYGWGCILIIILLSRYLKEPITLFVMATLICSILEYVTSYYMEKRYNARWWDYSNKKFNLNGRICLEMLGAFGALGLFIMYVVNPFLVNLLNKLPVLVLEILAVIVLIVYIVDSIISSFIIRKFKNEIEVAEEDKTEEITNKVRKELIKKGGLYKRLMNAFPQIKTYKERLNDMKDRLAKKISQQDKK